jgi:hypothetical protein
VFTPFNFLGFYLAPMLVYVCCAMPPFLIIRFALKRLGILNFVWNAPLFELAIYLILLALIAQRF